MFAEIREEKDNTHGWTYRLSIKEEARDYHNVLICYVSYTIRFDFEPFKFQGIHTKDLEQSFESLMNHQDRVKTAHRIAVRFCRAIAQNEESVMSEIKSKSIIDRGGDLIIHFDDLQSILMAYILGE
jgi:hypothetical protein